VAESNGQDVRVPWFSGLCLQGEVAGQYEMEHAATPQGPEDTGEAGVLVLDGLAPITIFVGANNSGKSRLMRELFKIQAPTRIKQCIKAFEGDEIDIATTIVDWLSSCPRIRDIPCERGWIAEGDREDIRTYLAQLENKIDHAERNRIWGEAEGLRVLQSKLLGLDIEKPLSGIQHVSRYYLPMLRGMRPPFKPGMHDQINERDNDWYQQRTKQDYFVADDMNSKIGLGAQKVFTGLGLYDDLRSRLLAKTQTIRDSVRKYEQFLSTYFFAGQEVILIPVEEGHNDVVHIKIGNKEERPIYDLGDGMQSLIICTYPIVTETEPGSLFFLEEPDLCMHPSLQRTFLEVLKTYHRKIGHQFFITTHSNHLLDLLEDNELVSIFSFSEIADRAPAPTDPSQADSGSNPQQSKPMPSFRIRPSNLRERQILLDLGVRPSATFLANATIWVEGVSDCAYLRAYMETFVYYLKVQGKDWGERLAQRLEQYKEDRHYAFVEYNGSNLVHFSFESNECDAGQGEEKSGREIRVPDLCATAIVIADGDVREKGDRSTWLEDQLRERFVCLPGKEIENLIPEALMKRQIIYDHEKRRSGKVAQDVIETIAYASYARSLEGVGAYLGKDRNIPKYLNKPGKTSDPGTLPTTYKTRWRSEFEGIPSLLREAINPESSANKPEQNDLASNPAYTGESIKATDLPDYFTQDLIWLCVLIFSHIASCNHDTIAEGDLNEFKQFIENQYPILDLACQEFVEVLNESNENPEESSQWSEALPSPWPIPDPGKCETSRNCLLTAFLDRTSKPEAIPSPHPESQAQATSTTSGPTASPAS
jgi:hypothetical protein